jgi:hypothetical protein
VLLGGGSRLFAQSAAAARSRRLFSSLPNDALVQRHFVLSSSPKPNATQSGKNKLKR